jgi:hypothetical protein
MPHPLALAAAFQLAAELASQDGKLKHAQLMAELHASVLKHMVDAIVTRRIDVIQGQCRDVLAMYAEQSRACIEEKKPLSAKLLDCGNDVLLRNELVSRCNKIDIQQAEIRADAKVVFERMCEFVLAIGGKDMGFAGDLLLPLGFSPRVA